MQEQKNKKKKLMSRILYYVLLGFFSLVFVFSAVYIVKYLATSAEAGNEYGDLSSQREQLLATLTTEEPTEPLPPETDPSTGETVYVEPTEPTILPELQPFYEQNNDLVGWIYIPNTQINYPVMQTPDNPNYYLNHTFEHTVNDRGCIYVREQCDVFAPSDTITIYGHHMKTGYKYSTMFRDLDGYKKQAFWQENQYVYFDTLYERHTYQIIAAFKTSANYGEGFAYHLFSDADTEEDFNEFVATVKSLSFYDTGLTAEYGDKLITLSTCEYSLDNGRFVVVAKRIS